MLIFDREFEALRWPWQKGFNWKGATSAVPQNGEKALPRFGGWSHKLGVDFFGTDHIQINLIYGTIKVRKAPRCAHCGKRMKFYERGTRYWSTIPLPNHRRVTEDMIHQSCLKELEPWNHA